MLNLSEGTALQDIQDGRLFATLGVEGIQTLVQSRFVRELQDTFAR